MPIADHYIEMMSGPNGPPLSPAQKYWFLTLKGNIEMRQQQAERLSRAGVNGHGFRRTGTRGRPFVLTSIVDAPNLAIAADLFGLRYRNTPFAGFAKVVKDGLDWGNYMVEHVSLISLKASVGIGGFSPAAVSKLGLPPGYTVANGDSGALLVCRWSLHS